MLINEVKVYVLMDASTEKSNKIFSQPKKAAYSKNLIYYFIFVSLFFKPKNYCMKILKPALATLLFFFLVHNAFSAFVFSEPKTQEKPKQINGMTVQEQRAVMEQFVKLTPKNMV